MLSNLMFLNMHDYFHIIAKNEETKTNLWLLYEHAAYKFLLNVLYCASRCSPSRCRSGVCVWNLKQVSAVESLQPQKTTRKEFCQKHINCWSCFSQIQLQNQIILNTKAFFLNACACLTYEDICILFMYAYTIV